MNDLLGMPIMESDHIPKNTAVIIERGSMPKILAVMNFGIATYPTKDLIKELWHRIQVRLKKYLRPLR